MVEHLKTKQADTPKRDISHSVAQQREIPDRNGYVDRFARPEYYPIRETGSVVQMYYAEDSKEPRTQAPSGTFSPIVQRKIGMEYQTVGNGNNVFEYKDNKIEKNESHGEILFTVPYEKDKEIAVTADGGDLEYVTPAVDTPEEAYRAGSAVAEIHRLLRTYNDAKLSVYGLRAMQQHETKNIQGYEKYNTGEDKRSWECTTRNGDYILMNIAETAHPQATVGIRMDKIVDLFSDLGGTEGGNAESGNAKGSNAKDGNVIKDASGIVTLGPTSFWLSSSDLKKQKEALQNALQKAWEAVENYFPQKIIDKKRYKSLVGILAFLYAENEQFQIIAGKPKAAVNAKNAMLVMNRTSLYDAYCKLSDEEREIFEYIMHKVPLEVPEEGGKDTGGWLGVKSTLETKTKTKGKTEIKTEKHPLAGQIILAGQMQGEEWNALTLQDWVKGMMDPKNQIDNDFDSVGRIENKNTGWLDAFNIKRSTDIGSQEGVDGMLVELRGLERGVKYDRWGEMAWRVARLTDYLNKRDQPFDQPIEKQDEKQVTDALGNMKGNESSLPQQMQKLMQQRMLLETPQQLQEQLQELPNLQNQLTQLPNLEEQMKQRQKQMTQLSNLQNQLKNLQNYMTIMEHQQLYIKRQFPILRDQMNNPLGKQNQPSQIKKQLLEIKRQITQMREQLPQMRDQLPQMREQLPQMRDQLPQMRDQLPQIKRQMTQMKKQLLRQQMLQKRLSRAKEWLQDKMPQSPDWLKEIDNQLSEKQKQLDLLQEQMTQLPDQQPQIEEQLSEKQKQLHQLEKRLEHRYQRKQLQEQQAQVQQMGKQLQQLQQLQQTKEWQPEIEEWLQQTKEWQPKIEEWLQQIEQWLPQIGEQPQQKKKGLPNIEERLSQIEEGLQQIEQRLQQIEQRLPQIEKGLPQIEKGLPQIEKWLLQIEERLQQKNKRPIQINKRTSKTEGGLSQIEQRRSQKNERPQQKEEQPQKGLPPLNNTSTNRPSGDSSNMNQYSGVRLRLQQGINNRPLGGPSNLNRRSRVRH